MLNRQLWNITWPVCDLHLRRSRPDRLRSRFWYGAWPPSRCPARRPALPSRSSTPPSAASAWSEYHVTSESAVSTGQVLSTDLTWPQQTTPEPPDQPGPRSGPHRTGRNRPDQTRLAQTWPEEIWDSDAWHWYLSKSRLYAIRNGCMYVDR